MTVSIEETPLKQNGKNITGYTSYAAFDDNTGLLHIELTQFLHWLALAKTVRPESKVRHNYTASASMYQYAHRIKRWFNWLDEVWNHSVMVELSKDESERSPNVSIDQIVDWKTADDFVYNEYITWLESQDDSSKDSRNNARWIIATFYDQFCTFMGYSHQMSNLFTITEGNDYSSDATHLLYNLVPQKKRKFVAKGYETPIQLQGYRTISMEDLSKLHFEMEDPVYVFISYWMLVTGLRIEPITAMKYPGIDDEFPLWLTPAEMKSAGIEDVFKFRYIPKGNKDVNKPYHVDVSLCAWESIWNGYYPLLRERLTLWRKKYKKSKTDYPDTLWLTENGKPVETWDIQEAFKSARRSIQSTPGNRNFPNVTPHWLRHTYACSMIKAYAAERGIELDVTNESALHIIHEYVKEQLGHKQLTTTKRYIYTLTRYVRNRFLPKITPRLEKDGKTIFQAAIIRTDLEEVHKVIDFHATVNYHQKLAT
ncbi:site-specific integrase [Vibrio parahaemolyticus]|nr:site-specific integrase [Vibrio parahaemolyticus]